MLNRTNRTLSAHSNRLNLGTRTLDLKASGNIGNLTLRTAHHFPSVVVRTGVEDHSRIMVEAPPIVAEPKPMKPVMSAMSGSSPRSLSPSRDFRAWDQGQTVVLSQPVQPFAVLRDGVGIGQSVKPPVRSSQSDSRSSLDWRCVSTRRAGRSARAALALVTEAPPSIS